MVLNDTMILSAADHKFDAYRFSTKLWCDQFLDLPTNCVHINQGQTTKSQQAPYVILTTFLEYEPSKPLLSWIDQFQDSFVFVVTGQSYQDIPPVTDRYQIMSLRYYYGFYSKCMPKTPIPIVDRHFTKKFLSLNNRSSWPRLALAQALYQSKLLDDCFFSYRFENRSNQGKRALFESDNQLVGKTWFNQSLDIEEFYSQLPIIANDDDFDDYDSGNTIGPGNEMFYSKSFASFVNETYIDENGDAFLTEKAFKPISYGHPFLLFSSAGAIGKLKQLGFETFSDIFDESYDDIASPQQRFEFLLREMFRICQMRLTDLQEMYYNAIPRLEHNQHLFRQDLVEKFDKELSEVKQQILSRVMS
jgi:hypothetical protein